MDIARLGIQIDSSDLKDAQSKMRATAAAGKDMARDIKVVSGQVRRHFGVMADPRTGAGAAARGVSGLADSSSRLARVGSSHGIRNAAMQLSQVVEQGSMLGGPGGYIRAMAIQLPDLTMGFGLAGMAIGVAGAALGPMVANLFEGEKGARSLGEALESLQDISGAYGDTVEALNESNEKLSESYGDAVSEARELLATQAELQRAEAASAIRGARGQIADELGGGTLTTAAGLERAEALSQRSGGRGADVARQQIEALDDLAEKLGTTREGALEVNQALSALATAEGPEELAQSVIRLNELIRGTENGLDGISGEARTQLQQATSAALESLKIAANDARRDGEAFGEAATEGAERGIEAGAPGVMDAARSLAGRVATTMREALDIRSPSRVMQEIGRYAAEGLGVGLRDGRPAIQSAVSDTAGIMGSLRDSVSGILTGILTDTQDFTQTLESSLRSAANRMVSSGVDMFVSSLFGSFGGPGMTTGTPLTIPAGGAEALLPPSFAGGGYTGSGPRTGGLDGKGGFPAILHPRETVVDHTKGGGGGTQRIDVRVYVDEDGQWQGRVEQIAGDVTQRGLAAYDRQLPGRVQQSLVQGRNRRQNKAWSGS